MSKSPALPSTENIATENRAIGRGDGVTGPRRSASILESLASVGIACKSDVTLARAGIVLACLAHAGLHRWIVDGEGKPGKHPRLVKLPKVEGVTFASCKVPALGRCPAGLEIVDQTGKVWRMGSDGKPSAVVTLKPSKTVQAALDSCQDDAAKAGVWLAYHVASHDMVGGIVAGLPKSKPEAAKPETDKPAEPQA